MPSVELSGGRAAVLRGPETVRNRERRNAARATDKVAGVAAKDIVMIDTMIAQLLESWTLELPLPNEVVDLGALFDDLEIEDYEKLRDAAMEVYAQARGLVVEPDDNTDPTTPTEPLGD